MQGFWTFTLVILLHANYLLAQAYVDSPDHKYPIEPAFEKVYIQKHQLVSMPDGLYYFAADGTSLKVRTVLSDCDGMYIIAIKHQCPCCGRILTGGYEDGDYACPIYQKKVHPRIWSD